jgi:hypothetical protein
MPALQLHHLLNGLEVVQGRHLLPLWSKKKNLLSKNPTRMTRTLSLSQRICRMRNSNPSPTNVDSCRVPNGPELGLKITEG